MLRVTITPTKIEIFPFYKSRRARGIPAEASRRRTGIQCPENPRLSENRDVTGEAVGLKGVVRILERCNVIRDVLSEKQMAESIFRSRAADGKGGEGTEEGGMSFATALCYIPLLLKRILSYRAPRFARENSGT